MKKIINKTNIKDITVIPIGGYSEVGRNCVAVKIREEVFILDMGLSIGEYIEYTEQEGYDQVTVSGKKLIEIGAAPDIHLLGDLKKKVKAILLTHAHLDHILGVPYLANQIKAPLYATPFTAEIILTITRDEKKPLKQPLIVKESGTRWKLTDDVDAEFIHLTHSCPDTVAIVLHSKYGSAMYATDYKFDDHPTKGERSDEKGLKRCAGVDVLITDALYAQVETKCPSENYVRSMLFNLMTKEKTKGKLIVATTFASHIYRLLTLVELAKKLGRRPMFLGRSLAKYITVAEKLGMADFSKHADIVMYGGKVQGALKKIRNPEEYFFISTGNQGEPKAALHKIVAQNWLPFQAEDIILFSSITIPVEPNMTYREDLERLMKEKKLDILKDIHVSGHGTQVDMRKLIKLVKPKHIIPMHAEPYKLEKFKELAKDEGYEKVHIVHNGDHINVSQ